MKILMHTCCGPCAVYPLEVINSENHDVCGYFYNNNIHPWTEYKSRLDAAKKLYDYLNIDFFIEDDYDIEGFLSNVALNPKNRCNYCYANRLEKTAIYAKNNGFDAFTTSLLVSPYQKHELIKTIGERIAEKYNIRFFYRDFRPGYWQGRKKAKELGLYMQKYCGCIYSEKERYLNK
ncbi:epoxyqueuosine reductase QueH [Caldicellulosiruptoraceae bacterium PP1]